jgi:deoxyadenosine/deoxycytidine kinase
MENHIVVLMGTSGVGKSSVARSLEDNGYSRVSLDDIIHRMREGCDNDSLKGHEVNQAYLELSKQVAQALESSNVVVDEWFYNEGTLDVFLTDIDPHTPVHYFHLTGDLDTLLERARSDPNPKRLGKVEKHYGMTYDKPGRYYRELPLRTIDIAGKSPHDIKALITKQVR